MSIDTKGRIKGFIPHEDIISFIRTNWDENVKSNIKIKKICPLNECTWAFKINEHSTDNNNWYVICGTISFQYNNVNRSLFYIYDNINSFENMKHYEKVNLQDMVRTETTKLSLGCWGESINIIKEIITHFGGGWIDENDCDEKEYYVVETSS